MHPQRVFFILFLVLFCDSAFAGTVLKTNGKKVYIVFDKSEGGTFAKDDLFNLTDANGKKIGVVELKKVKGLKAIGLLKKGRATKGNGTLFRTVGKKSKKMKTLDGTSTKTAKLDTDDEYDQPSGNSRFGLQLGYGMAKQDVQQNLGTAAQTGSSMAIKAILDYPLFGNFNLHGGLGAEMFSVSGTGENATTGATDVEVTTKITYLSIDALMRWNIMNSSTKFYLLGGAGLLHPLSKTSDTIDPGTITSLAVGEFGAGAEFRLGGYSIPLEAVYLMFPDGETVKTSVISVRVGVYF